ncbi:MAG: PP2C family protein-serine/threonine phosphatase [Candidatus Gracilibacteria bacterium]|nr:PP2C family protein-serine/threonine phosphatase [Candidatus Gracilibacteria bacterium]
MFNFLKRKKKVDTSNVQAFDSAINAIKLFIASSDWINGKKAIEEILFKEKEAINLFLEKFSTDENKIENKKLIEKEKKKYKKKEETILKLKTNLDKLETKYIKRVEIERFKIRFQKIKDEIVILIKTNKSLEAMNLLQNFLEENKENSTVISFYNKEKKIVQKSIEKNRKIEQEKLKKNAKIEALQLIGETAKIDKIIEKEKQEKKGFFVNIGKKLNFYKNIKENRRRKKLLDEINILIEEDTRLNNEIAEKKLENIHRGLVKEINKNNIIGYDLYGKILGADKISGDTFGLEESDKKYNFFIGDATGHGIRAGFIITLINKLFKENYNKDLNELAFNINNSLKQDLKSRNFVTGIFFEINKETSEIGYVGMGHEPILIYRKDTNTIEKLIPGGLAAGIRLINEIDDIKVKTIKLNDGDILITYSDGIIENKNLEGEYYGIEKLEKSFKMVTEYESNIKNIYEYLINDVKIFRSGTNFDDDLSVIIIKRDTKKDIVKEDDNYLLELKAKEGLDRSDIKNLKGKNKEEIEEAVEEIKRKKETKRLIKNLENLFYTGEILKLKEEATRYIKEGYIDPKINSYLRRAIDNEKNYRIEQKNQKMEIKFNILSELYKKGDYNTVIKEIEEIISKDGNI